ASEAPAYVTVVTSDEIKQFGYRTLADILNGVNGLYVTYDRTYSYLGVRGFNRPGDFNSRMLVMVDGHRLNDNVYEGAYIGREFILDVDLIERVEVVRGPSSSLYGSSAFFAVVNVITKRAAAVKNLEVSAEAGSFDARKGRVTVGGVCTNTGAEVLLSATRYQSRGAGRLYYPEFDAPSNNNGIADRRDGELADNYFGSLHWRDLTASAAYVYRDKDIPTASWGTLFNDPRYHFIDSHGYVDVKWDHKISEQTTVMLRGYYDEISYTADYPVTPETSPEDLGLNRDVSLGRMLGGEAQVMHRWGLHTFMLGGELRRHFNQDYGNYDVAPFRQNSDVARNSYDGGVFVQDEIALTTNLLLNIGARYDYYEDFGGSLNPRLGLIYSPWDKGTFKLLYYGRAFRAPSVNEIYGPWGTNSPNAGLGPESIQTYELVYEQALSHNLRLTLAGYYYHIDDLISPDPSGLTYVNLDTVNTKGVETELEWRHASGVRLRAGYSLQRAEDANTGARLSNSPEQLAKFRVLLPLVPERVFTGLEVLYAGRADALPDRATPHADAYWIANLTLFSQKLVEGLEISASLYNLLNTGYAVPVGAEHMQDLIYQDGRSLRVKLTYRF
ncbi:MAG: TonB-dependent receptor, partial [Kiritimatiellaeota bacterium]|nr:TonB-dependent receptor [Kiritimatiellota bacterium]